MTQVQIPDSLDDRIQPLLEEYGYSTLTDFTREALREKADELEGRDN